MKILAITLMILTVYTVLSIKVADECPHDLKVRCNDEINKAYPVCNKAIGPIDPPSL